MKKILALVLGSMLFAGSAMATQFGRQLDAMQQIGTTGIFMVQSQGKSFFMDRTGRFVIKGTLHDMWNGQKVIATTDDLAYANTHVNFDKMGLKTDDLLHVRLGHGEKKVRIFMAPGCPHCHKVLAEAKELADKYTFEIFPLPILGKASEDACERLSAHFRDEPTKALEAVLSDQYEGLEKKEGTDYDPMRRGLIASQFLGITSVPVIYTPDGRQLVGAPKQGLASALEM